MSRTEVLIVYPILHHYRRAVFLELDRSERFRYTFAADVGGHNGIAAMDPEDLQHFVRLRTRRWRGLEFQTGLLRWAWSSRFDTVVFLGAVSSISTWLAASVARLRGKRVHYWTIGWHRPETGLRRAIRLIFYRQAHSLLLYGQTARNIGIQIGYPAERMHVIGNSVGADISERARGELHIPEREAGVLTLGAVIRLNPVKRLDLLIEAAARLRQRGVDVRLLIVGEGPVRAQLEDLAHSLGVPLSLPGAAYGAQQLSVVYSVLDITVVPSAVGLSAVQSLGNGVPVISDDDPYSQMPEWEAIVPGVTGQTYARDDVDDLINAILLVAARLDRDPIEVEQACREEVEARWNPSAHAARIEDAIRRESR